jgi:D-alanyl-D-alanine dipeptidase
MTAVADAGAGVFTDVDHRRRIERIGTAAAAAGLSGLLITPGPDLFWLTGYRPTAADERLTVLVVAAGLEPTLVVPAHERPDVEAVAGAPAVTVLGWRDWADPYRLVGRLLRPDGRYGVSDSAWSTHLLRLQRELPRARYSSLADHLPLVRAVKDAPELERVTAAAAAADRAYEEIVRVRFAGRREIDVAVDLTALLHRFGHEQVHLAVVGSGPNGTDPHHRAGTRVIRPGDVVVLGLGGLRDGYGSDTTRTVCVGAPSTDAVEVHRIVREAQEAAVAAVRPGLACGEIDDIARAVITDAGFGDLFVHRTGHGVGVTTHEPPYLVRPERRPLLAGMCLAVEPGIYLPGEFGTRIGDVVAVTADGGHRCNGTSRELAIVG